MEINNLKVGLEPLPRDIIAQNFMTDIAERSKDELSFGCDSL
jgi:hypothetical protein